MKNYHILINGKYFVAFGELKGKAPNGGWYDTGKGVRELILTNDKKKAKLIEGMINLKSFFNQIYDSIRYGEVNFEINTIEFRSVEQ